jgi:hypothetical protein
MRKGLEWGRWMCPLGQTKWAALSPPKSASKSALSASPSEGWKAVLSAVPRDAKTTSRRLISSPKAKSSTKLRLIRMYRG